MPMCCYEIGCQHSTLNRLSGCFPGMTSLLGKSKQIIGVHFQTLFMAALWNRAGHYIFMLWFLSSSSIYLLFFLAWSQRPHIGCLPYFDTWCGLSANL